MSGSLTVLCKPVRSKSHVTMIALKLVQITRSYMHSISYAGCQAGASCVLLGWHL